jgi:large subunit ribosomal protein L19
MNRVRKITDTMLDNKNLVDFSAGDTVKVFSIIKEIDAKGVEKQRIQMFQGVCIKRKNAGISSTFTVRKISSGIGVERVFALHSPMIDKIELVNKGKVRRANISYIKKLKGKAARIQTEEVKRDNPKTKLSPVVESENTEK